METGPSHRLLRRCFLYKIEVGCPEVLLGRIEFALNAQLQNQQRRFQWILLLVFLLTLPLVNPWVRGDGVGYYAYARAPLIEHSLDFTHDYQFANESFRQPCFDENGQIRTACRTRTGHLENHFSVGPAMLWSPFLLATHVGVLLARTTGAGVAANGFSLPYRYAMAFSTGLYGFLGLWLSFRLASKYVAPVCAFIATLAIWWSSSLPVYMYFNPSWSHAHSAFVCALFLWYWDATRESRSTVQWVVLGLITGLMLDVYYANLMIVSVVAVEGVWKYRDIRSSNASPSALLQLLSRQALFGLVVCVAMIPTFVSRAIVYGGPLESGYISIRDYLWHSPVFFGVLFSSEHGLISWTPVLALAIVGLFLFAFRVPKAGVPLVSALIAFYLFISLYPDWAGISSYGNRFFISLTPIFILGLGYFMERAAMLFLSQRTALAVCSGVLTVFVLWNLGMIYQWGLHLVPPRGPISFREAAYNQFCVVPGRLSSSLKNYFLHRSELMRQIEKKDMEELDQSAAPELSR
jgi:hypothetical protein